MEERGWWGGDIAARVTGLIFLFEDYLFRSTRAMIVWLAKSEGEDCWNGML